MKRPELYIFDDSFSALDTATDARLRQALKPHTAGATLVIVAQRVSSISTPTRSSCWTTAGSSAHGTHAELLETSPTYQEIVTRSSRRRRQHEHRGRRPPPPSARRAPPRGPRPAGGPGRGGPFAGMNIPAEKSMNFGPSAQRLLGELRPERLWLMLVLVLAVVAWRSR